MIVHAASYFRPLETDKFVFPRHTEPLKMCFKMLVLAIVIEIISETTKMVVFRLYEGDRSCRKLL